MDQRPTDAPYSAQESDAIIADLRAERAPTCPRCGGVLEKGESTTSSHFSVFIVRCPTCRRALFAGEYAKAMKKPG